MMVSIPVLEDIPRKVLVNKVPTTEYNRTKYLLKLRLLIHSSRASLLIWKVVIPAVPAKSRHIHQTMIIDEYNHQWNPIGSVITAEFDNLV